MLSSTRFFIAAGLPLLVALPISAQQTSSNDQDGKHVFEMVCSMCHSVAPPAKAAPPMSHATAYYLRKHPKREDAESAIVAYLRAPDAKKSVMPAHVIERFGLMPAQGHLSEAQLKAVAKYVLTIADTAHVRGMGHDGHR